MTCLSILGCKKRSLFILNNKILGGVRGRAFGEYTFQDGIPGFPPALEILENLENHKKSSMHGKIMKFEKKTPEKSWNFVK